MAKKKTAGLCPTVTELLKELLEGPPLPTPAKARKMIREDPVLLKSYQAVLEVLRRFEDDSLRAHR